jgi:exosortase E/protease (VPEID-CTERM system)
MLGAELLTLSVGFDTEVFKFGDSWWVALLDNAPVFLRIGLAAGVGFLVVSYPRLRLLGAEVWRGLRWHRRWLPWLIIHGLLFLFFYRQTALLFDAAAQKSFPSLWLAGGWAFIGGSVLLSWMLALLPLSVWTTLIARERLALLAAGSAGIATWALGELTREFWRPLAGGTFLLARLILSGFYDEVVLDPVKHVLGTPNFLVAIAPECSGYEGIGLITVFLAIYLWLFRNEVKFPRALVLFPLGALTIWLANAVRIAVLVAIGSSFSREVAVGGFHSQAGWIVFAMIALAIVFLIGRFGIFSKESSIAQETDTGVGTEAQALILPLLVLLASVMLTSALSHGFDILYPLRPVVVGLTLWHFRAIYRTWQWTVSGSAIAVGIAVFILWLVLEPASDSSALLAGLNALSPAERLAWIGMRVFGSVLIVPLAEELAFRGYLLRRLVAADFESVPVGRFTWLSLLGSSLAFGLVHGRWLAATLAGMAYAYAVYRNGRLCDAVVAHLVSNALIALCVIAFGNWGLWT